MTLPETQNVPSKNRGRLLYFCTEIQPGEVVPPPDQIIEHPRTPRQIPPADGRQATSRPGRLIGFLDDKLAAAKQVDRRRRRSTANTRKARSREATQDQLREEYEMYYDLSQNKAGSESDARRSRGPVGQVDRRRGRRRGPVAEVERRLQHGQGRRWTSTKSAARSPERSTASIAGRAKRSRNSTPSPRCKTSSNLRVEGLAGRAIPAAGQTTCRHRRQASPGHRRGSPASRRRSSNCSATCSRSGPSPSPRTRSGR